MHFANLLLKFAGESRDGHGSRKALALPVRPTGGINFSKAAALGYGYG